MKSRPFTKYVLLFLITGGLVLPLRGQTLPFLGIDVDSRAAAMGGTQLASAGQAMTLFTNPAGLATVSGLQFATTATNWLLDIQHYGGVAAYQVDGFGTMGVSTVWMDYGTFDRTVPATKSPEGYLKEGTFSVAEYAVGLAYARPLTSRWFLGGQVKMAGQRLPTGGNASATLTGISQHQFLLFDFGTIYTPGWHDMRIGFTMRNLTRSSDTGGGLMPGWSDVGVALDALSLVTTTPNHTLTAVFDWRQIPEQTAAQHLGFEYGLQQQFFLRSGYQLGYEQQGITAGVGFRIPIRDVHVQADYAYNDFGEFFGAVHRLTVGFQIE